MNPNRPVRVHLLTPAAVCCRVSASAALSAALLSLAACAPIKTENKIVIEQPKPLEINVNLSGRLELVITDARQDLEKITGEKPKRQIRPEDIGLPPAAEDKAGTATPPPFNRPEAIALLADFSGSYRDPANRSSSYPGLLAVASSEDQLVQSMATRNAAVLAILSAHVAGEAHTGLLAEKGTLTAAQRATLTAENADRTELYKLRAAKSGTAVADAALAYYLQRLGYAEKGDWVETFNKQTKQWEWTQWSG